MKAPINVNIARLTDDSKTALDFYLKAAQAETTSKGRFSVVTKENGHKKKWNFHAHKALLK